MPDTQDPLMETSAAGKTMTSRPEVAGGDKHVELERVATSADGPALAEDIMQLARVGDIASVQTLFESGRFSATYHDSQGITTLHWAAINNQYAMCRFLLDNGADVNRKGGESVATPAMWAAQRGHYYTVHLLLQHGADPLITDVQGYNILHLATFEGDVFLLVLLLHQGIPVDVPDNQGHSCLMWSAYKGFPACVDLFLRWGASVHMVDATGFTALHWALVKGSAGCIQKLVEYGSNRFQPAASGKTPAVMAEEMKTIHAWHKALKDCGYREDATAMELHFPMSSRILQDKATFMARFFFLWPLLVIWSMIMIASHMVVFAAVPLALFVGYALQYVAQALLPYTPPNMQSIHKTPWLAGIFASTLLLVGIRWLTTILPHTYTSFPFSNAAFGLAFALCAYFYFCTMSFEPGFVPRLGGLSQQKDVIDELLSLWKFDDQNFCVPCMVRMPLRSKHCRRCNRCVAKHDHHCPWVYNCIGINNHRQFFLYLTFLELGIAIIVRLTIAYYDSVAELSSDECNLLAPALCRLVNYDSYTMILMIWAALQLTWVTMLLFVQLVQIARAVTTYENMRGTHHTGSGRVTDAVTSALTTGTLSMRSAQVTGSGRNAGPNPSSDHIHDGHDHHHHKEGCLAQWRKILGVDAFVETALNGYEGNKNRKKRGRNPFSRGCCQNCRDFWCDPAPIFGNRENGEAVLDGVPINYTQVYETPSAMEITRPSGHSSAGAYHAIATDDTV